MARYLVTGGCGFIGSHLTHQLINDGHQVRVLDSLVNGKLTNIPQEADFIHGDIRDEASVVQAIQETDGCFHLAAIPSVEQSNEQWVATHQVNLTGTISVFNAARTATNGKPTPVVYASSAAVYGDNPNIPLAETTRPQPLTAYGADKLACEHHARVASLVHKVPTLGLRFFNVYGPRQDPNSPYSGVISIFHDQIKQKKNIIIHGDGNQKRDFIYVQDVVDCLVRGMATDMSMPKILNVCSGVPTRIKELGIIMARLLDVEIVPTYTHPRVGDITLSYGDPQRAKRHLALNAIDLLEGLHQTLAK